MEQMSGYHEKPAKKEQLAPEVYWRPIEDKEFSAITLERFRALNQVRTLDPDQVFNALGNRNLREGRDNLLIYLLHELEEKAQDQGIGPEEKNLILDAIIRSADGLHTAETVRTLGKIGGDMAAKYLIKNAEEFKINSYDYKNYVSSLALTGSDLAYDYLRTELSLADENTPFGHKAYLVSAIAETRRRDAYPILLPLIKDADLSLTALATIGKVAGPENIKEIVENAGDDIAESNFLLDSIQEIEDEEALEFLVGYWENRKEGIAAHTEGKIAKAMGKYAPNEKALAMLKELAATRNGWYTAQSIACSLAGWEYHIAKPVLLILAENDDRIARMETIRAIADQGGTEAIPDLQELADREADESIRSLIYQQIERNQHTDLNYDELTNRLVCLEEPMLALAEHVPGLVERITETMAGLKNLVDGYQQTHPGLLGCSISGSLLKGYWNPKTSDLDMSLIYDFENDPLDNHMKYELWQAFQEDIEARKLPLACKDIPSLPDFSERVKGESLLMLLTATFVGDRKRLEALRERTLASLSAEANPDITARYNSSVNAVMKNYNKLQRRLGFNEDQILMIGNLRSYLWHKSIETEVKAPTGFIGRLRNLRLKKRK